MFGMGWTEFFVVLLVAILVIPAEHWPEVAKFLAKCVKVIRDLIWKISDVSENIKDQIELEKPINDLMKRTTDDVLAGFSSARSDIMNKPKSVISTSKKTKRKITKKTKGSSKL